MPGNSIVQDLSVAGVLVLGLNAYVFWKEYWRYRKQKLQQQLKRRLADPEKKVIIIGAGISGLCAAIKLQEKGIPFEIHEKKGGVGGTWIDNIYPGSGCDVPSFLYSYSFEPNLSWSRKWASQKEILDYIDAVTKKYELYQHIRFYSEIDTATFDQEDALWNLTTTSGSQLCSRWVICSTGQLNLPNFPSIPGRDSFKGESFHSARWNYDVDLKGKTVAVIGTGASAIQFVPPISEQVRELFVFQRSPSHIDQKNDYRYSKWIHFLFNYVPGVARAYRYFLYLAFESLWPFFQQGRMNTVLGKIITGQMKKTIGESENLDQLVPRYALGCKRILISNEYFPTLAKDHVHLIDSPVTEITESGVISAGEERAVDVIIYGTGFQSYRFLFPIEIQGLNGRKLNEVWKDHPFAFWGLTVPEIPNMFITYGPTTNLVHNSIIFMIECQVQYIVQSIDKCQRNDVRYISLKQEQMDKYSKRCETALKTTVFDTDCGGWYKTPTGALVNNSAFSTLTYWWNTCVKGFSFHHYNMNK